MAGGAVGVAGGSPVFGAKTGGGGGGGGGGVSSDIPGLVFDGGSVLDVDPTTPVTITNGMNITDGGTGNGFDVQCDSSITGPDGDSGLAASNSGADLFGTNLSLGLGGTVDIAVTSVNFRLSLLGGGILTFDPGPGGTMGFFGASSVGQQTGGPATAGPTYGTTEQGMLNAVYAALQAYGLIT